MTPSRVWMFGLRSGTIELDQDEQEDVDRLIAEAQAEPRIYWKQSCTHSRQIIVLKNALGEIKVVVARVGMEMVFNHEDHPAKN